jgi:hypothetical protein
MDAGRGAVTACGCMRALIVRQAGGGGGGRWPPLAGSAALAACACPGSRDGRTRTTTEEGGAGSMGPLFQGLSVHACGIGVPGAWPLCMAACERSCLVHLVQPQNIHAAGSLNRYAFLLQVCFFN